MKRFVYVFVIAALFLVLGLAEIRLPVSAQTSPQYRVVAVNIGNAVSSGNESDYYERILNKNANEHWYLKTSFPQGSDKLVFVFTNISPQ